MIHVRHNTILPSRPKPKEYYIFLLHRCFNIFYFEVDNRIMDINIDCMMHIRRKNGECTKYNRMMSIFRAVISEIKSKTNPNSQIQ